MDARRAPCATPGRARTPARSAREPTRDTSRVGPGRESGTLGDPRAPHVAAGESRRDRRGTPAPPPPLCEACPARRRLAASPLRRHPPIERCAPGAYPACRAGFASRGTAVARGIVPSSSRLAPTRDMSLGSRSATHPLELRVRLGLAGQWASPGIGTRDVELLERPGRVQVDPWLAESARLRHALLVGALVGGKAALLEVQEHALRHVVDVPDGGARDNPSLVPRP